MRRRVLMWAIILLVWGLIPHEVSHAQTSPMCADDPMSCIGESFRDIWLKNNGPENFGLPVGDVRSQMSNNEQYITQEFERTRIDFFPTREAPNNLILARVGAEWLDANISVLMPLPTVHYDKFMEGRANCQRVSAESPAVCGPFLDFYMNNGIHVDALPYVHVAERNTRFGLPLTPAMSMMQNGEMRIVQVFERARLDWYPDDQYNKPVKIGAVVNEMIAAGQQRPTVPSPFVNQLVVTNQPVLPYEKFGRWQWGMPKFGYWSTSKDGIYVATSTIMYHDEFWSVKAPPGYRFVSMTVLIRNDRDKGGAPVYLDYSYLSLIDHIGTRVLAHELAQRLTTPIQPMVVTPGTAQVGQIIFLMSPRTVPAQLEINFANLDQSVSRFTQYIELRSYPKS
jgi:hypothetical protein